MDLVSVIIPVYRAEAYLRTCIDSILNQTYSNLEVILVDDGSPDNCGAICDEYAAADRRVRVIHQKNQGVSAARNAGLDIASGDYISFIDSDDYADPDMIEQLHRVAKETGVDITECNYRRTPVSDNGDGSIRIHTGTQALEILFTQDGYPYGFTVSPCTKLIKASASSDLRFLNHCGYAEDMLYVVGLFSKVNTVAKLNKRLYTYRLTEGSATSRPYSVYMADEVDAAEAAMKQMDCLESHSLRRIGRRRYLELSLKHWLQCSQRRQDNAFAQKAGNIRKRLLAAYPSMRQGLSRKQHLQYTLFRFFPSVYLWLFTRVLK